ncbi:hypothetical protein PAXRUDRAFT_672975 [Paxillus rubicundulus Ve08.2h10]|uniref:Unplaced genomic scaffold scaffold_675, whole genome shotgun sequence n=1 Tax=Paxillus rubicundulus Ve08.2h10 TaxID=930991 RepID=A0A0D0DI20_9AGAM|nr:hypothetical protein PAXRUDRAFT_672975 [Paxillus rubicundulus Ve08.2h10]
MITGRNAAPESSHGRGEILPFEWSHISIPQDDINLWSVAGLDDGDEAVSTPLVEKNLKLFLEEINLTAGIDLLVFCMRAGKAKFAHVRNYNVFYAAICRKKVPVVIVVLGSSADEHTWWKRNEGGLREKGMRFEKHVYIPCSTSSGQPLLRDDGTRLRLVGLLKEKYVSGTWRVGGDVFGMAAPDVRTLMGESWRREKRPTPTIAICDMTGQETLLEIAPGVRASLQSASVLINELEYRFERICPHSLTTTGSAGTRSHVSEHGNNGIRLLMFFMPATATEATWITLSQFYSAYKGDVIPLIIIFQGPTGQKIVENVWKDAPLNIQRRIGAYLTYCPELEANSEVQATTTTLTNMIEERCLVAFGARTLVLQGIRAYWKRYRPGRSKDPTGRN